jgi:hypothetical protein
MGDETVAVGIHGGDIVHRTDDDFRRRSNDFCRHDIDAEHQFGDLRVLTHLLVRFGKRWHPTPAASWRTVRIPPVRPVDECIRPVHEYMHKFVCGSNGSRHGCRGGDTSCDCGHSYKLKVSIGESWES